MAITLLHLPAPPQRTSACLFLFRFLFYGGNRAAFYAWRAMTPCDFETMALFVGINLVLEAIVFAVFAQLIWWRFKVSLKFLN